MIDLTWQPRTATEGIDEDFWIFGDWGYGDSESARYVNTNQYGDTRLEKKLWGDADTILAGTGYGTNNAYIYAGDGDDYIETEYGHYGLEVHGGRGNDTIRWGGSDDAAATTHKIYGGLGDDLIGPTTYGADDVIG